MILYLHYKNPVITFLFRISVYNLLIPLLLSLFSFHSFSQAPSWLWANKTGGTTDDWATSVVADASGNVFATGHFYSPTITFGSTTLTNSGLTDIFLVKYDASGNVLWARKAGNAGSEWSSSVATDATGNVYVTGSFNSSTITFGSTTLTTAGFYDVFIAKYDAAGNVLWARRGGGTQTDGGTSVVVSASGGIYLAGSYTSSTATFGSISLFNGGWNDIFLVKYDASGNVLWGQRVGDQSEEFTGSIATDAAGNVYLSGFFASLDILIGTTTLFNPMEWTFEIFLAKYDASGNALWARSATGFADDYVNGIAVDGSGNVYITGFFGSSPIAFGSITLSGIGTNQLYLAKYDASGTVQWVINPGWGLGMDLTADACGDIYTTGDFGTSLTLGSTTLLSSGSYDVYVAKVSPSGSILWATKAGGTAFDASSSIAISPLNNDVFIAGYYLSSSISFGSLTLSGTITDGHVATLTTTCPVVILPVELLSFSGENQGSVNVLHWETASEKNSDYFSIQRSNTGENFESVGKVDAAGNSTVALAYSFEDTHPMQGINYYRLSQTDYDGTTSFSNVISIDNKYPGTNPLIIDSNPAHDFISINASVGFEWEIINTTGQLIARGEQENTIDISGFPGGIYFLNVKTKDHQYFRKFVKQ